jgi:Ni,Fe-hydrogenase maturation factor
LRALIELIPEQRRPNVTILGVEPEKVEYGMELSKTVSDALPQVVKLAKKKACQIRLSSTNQIQKEARV